MDDKLDELVAAVLSSAKYRHVSPEFVRSIGARELAIRPLRPESATEVRARLAAGGHWEGLVPPAVARFIRQQGLYGTAAPGPGV